MPSRVDTSGEFAVRFAFLLALTGLAIALLAPLVSPVPPEQDPMGQQSFRHRVTLADRGGLEIVASAAGLTVLAGFPLVMRRTPASKGAQRLAATGMVIVTLIELTAVGFLFLPSTILMVVAATRRVGDRFR